DLLDEATRLAGAEYVSVDAANMIRVLVERVRAAEADESEQSDEADYWVGQLERAEAERQEWADLWQRASMSVLTLQDDVETLTRERDAAREDCNKNASNVRRLTLELHEARGKLDKVRQWSDNNLGGAQNAALLAILDEE